MLVYWPYARKQHIFSLIKIFFWKNCIFIFLIYIMGWLASPSELGCQPGPGWAGLGCQPVTWNWAFSPVKWNGPGRSTGLGLSTYFQAGLQPMKPLGWAPVGLKAQCFQWSGRAQGPAPLTRGEWLNSLPAFRFRGRRWTVVWLFLECDERRTC